MNHMELIKRAWQMTWRYKVLWVFGILLALTGGSGGGFSGGGGGGGRGGGGGVVPPMGELGSIGPETWAGIILLCCCALLILAVVMTIVQLVTRAALYRSTDQIAATGTAPTWREGFRLGWTNRTFRLFLLELLVGVAIVLAALILLAVAGSPLLLLLLAKANVARVIGIALAIWLFLVWLLIVIVAAVVLSVLGQLWAREIVIADRPIGDAFASGIEILRRRWKDLGGFWLLMLAIGFGFGLVMMPVALSLLIGGGALAAGLGFAVHATTGSVIWAIVAGLPLFIVIMAIPLSVLEGVYLTFQYSAWTLAYREVIAAPAPAIEGGSAEPIEVK